MAKDKKHAVGTQVTYVPNEVDLGSRPRNQPMPATIVSSYEHEYTHPDPDLKGKKITREVVTLIVLQDTDAGVARKVRVPHKDDALEGEVYFE